MKNRVFTVLEVAEVLQVSTRTVYLLIREGSLPVVRVRGQFRILQTALDEFMRTGGVSA